MTWAFFFPSTLTGRGWAMCGIQHHSSSRNTGSVTYTAEKFFSPSLLFDNANIRRRRKSRKTRDVGNLCLYPQAAQPMTATRYGEMDGTLFSVKSWPSAFPHPLSTFPGTTMWEAGAVDISTTRQKACSRADFQKDPELWWGSHSTGTALFHCPPSSQPTNSRILGAAALCRVSAICAPCSSAALEL